MRPTSIFQRLFPPAAVPWAMLLLGIAACAAPAPAPLSEESAAIGLTMERRWKAGTGINSFSDKAYFIRLSGNGKLTTQSELYHSNYHKDDQVYLLNARPGRYVVVAVSDAVAKLGTRREFDALGTRRALDPLAGLDDFMVYTTYLNEDSILKTEVEVKPGNFTLMGSFLVEMAHSILYGDKAQRYFHLVVDQTIVDPYGNPLVNPNNSVASRANLVEDRRGKESEIRFLETALQHLEGSGWSLPVQSSLERARDR